jgi:methylmalonyl-CoA mutase N-terminal domain/subunit
MQEKSGRKCFTDLEIEIKPFYTEKDLEAIRFNPNLDLGIPGQFPYTRGIDPERRKEESLL